MLRTRDQWFEYAIERGTSGDMVFDILKDWKEESANREETIDTKKLAHLSLEVERKFRDRAWELGEDIAKEVRTIYPPNDVEGDCSGSMALHYALHLLVGIVELAAIMERLND